MTPEKIVQNSILDYLSKLEKAGYKVMYDRRQAGGFSYKMGIPDIWACINGYHVEIEVKRPGGELRPMQEKFRLKCNKLDIHWLCADSIEIVKNYIFEHFNIKI